MLLSSLLKDEFFKAIKISFSDIWLLSLCIVKQTNKTPLSPPSRFLIYKGGNFQDVLAVDNKTFFKNTLGVSKTTFEMSNIF